CSDRIGLLRKTLVRCIACVLEYVAGCLRVLRQVVAWELRALLHSFCIGLLLSRASYCTVCVTEAELLAMLESPLYFTVTLVEPTGNDEITSFAFPPPS